VNLYKEIGNLYKKTSPRDFPKLLRFVFGPNGELNISWEELLWDYFCSDKYSLSREDDIGLEFYWLGKKNPEYGINIGKAAKNILDDNRIQKQRWTNHYHWLAVLADEFIGIEKEELKKIVSVGGHLYGAATYSLLKRLGEIPAEFINRERANSTPKDLLEKDKTSSLDSSDLRKELLDAARQSEWIKLGIEPLIMQALLEYEIDQEFLDELAGKGNNGCLIAGVLAFCYELIIKPEYAISFISYYKPPSQQNSAVLNRLKSIAMLSQFALTKLDPSAKKEYITALLQAIDRDEYDKGHYFYELLRLQRSLTLEQIDALLPQFVQDNFISGLDRQVIYMLSEWVSSVADVTTKDKLKEVCTICFESLDMSLWNDDGMHTYSPVVLMFFPLLYWAVGGESDEKSTRIFARAIKLMFHHKSYSNVPAKPQQYEIIESVSPLLSCVPQHTLRNAFEKLMNFPDVEVRIWARLFHCFVEK
jgi:hypothetical protein